MLTSERCTFPIEAIYWDDGYLHMPLSVYSSKKRFFRRNTFMYIFTKFSCFTRFVFRKEVPLRKNEGK